MSKRKTERGIITLNSVMTTVRELVAKGCREVVIDMNEVEKTYTVSYYEPPQEWEVKFEEWKVQHNGFLTFKNAYEAGYKEGLRKAITLANETMGSQ